jgi:hypothetical protein
LDFFSSVRDDRMKKSKQVPWAAWTGSLVGSGWWPGTLLQSRGCRSGPWSSLASGTCHQTRALIVMNSSTRIHKKKNQIRTFFVCLNLYFWLNMSTRSNRSIPALQDVGGSLCRSLSSLMILRSAIDLGSLH